MNNLVHTRKYPVTQEELEQFWEDGVSTEKWNSMTEEEQEEYAEAIADTTNEILENEEKDPSEVPPPILRSIHKDRMTKNIPFTHIVMCPRFPGKSPVVQSLLDTTSIKKENEVWGTENYEELTSWWGNLIILYSLGVGKDREASADFLTLDDALTCAIEFVKNDYASDRPVYVDIPYFQAVNENNERVDWLTTCEFISGVFEREVNKCRINEGKPNYQIILGFWDKF